MNYRQRVIPPSRPLKGIYYVKVFYWDPACNVLPATRSWFSGSTKVRTLFAPLRVGLACAARPLEGPAFGDDILELDEPFEGPALGTSRN